VFRPDHRWRSSNVEKEILGLKTTTRRITLKAFANSSPGVALWQPWGNMHSFSRRRNSEGVASSFADRKAFATPSELRNNLCRFFQTQGFKANPGLALANAFSVIVEPEFPRTSERSWSACQLIRLLFVCSPTHTSSGCTTVASMVAPPARSQQLRAVA